MEYAITIEKLTKLYKKKGNSEQKIAVQELDLAVPKGCILGLLGPNGAGKSTLINILVGTVIKTSGSVKINGYDIDLTPKQARAQIGVVPQEVVLDSFFPISQTLEFTAGYYGIRPQLRKTEEILKALGLFNKKDSLPKQLSGGMKRRFLVAKAMVHSPPILILDEPTAGVDIELREQLWDYVEKLHNQGVTIIITTHYLEEAQKLCNYIAFINNGKIIKLDSKENLLNELGARYVDVEFTRIISDSELVFTDDIKYEILTNNKVRFQFNASSNLSNILHNIQRTEAEIKDLQVSQPELETIFKKLIKT